MLNYVPAPFSIRDLRPAALQRNCHQTERIPAHFCPTQPLLIVSRRTKKTDKDWMESAMKSAKPAETDKRISAELDERYGQIGISAVVAALRYRKEIKNAV